MHVTLVRVPAALPAGGVLASVRVVAHLGPRFGRVRLPPTVPVLLRSLAPAFRCAVLPPAVAHPRWRDLKARFADDAFHRHPLGNPDSPPRLVPAFRRAEPALGYLRR